MGKYKTIGSEIDKIYTELGKYKSDLNDANVMLDNMYEKNFEYYKELEKYIVTGNLLIEKLKTKNYQP